VLGLHRPEGRAVGAQRVGEHEGVAAVILGAGHGVAVAKAIELLGIEGEDVQAASSNVSTTAPRGTSIATAMRLGSAGTSAVSASAKAVRPRPVCGTARSMIR